MIQKDNKYNINETTNITSLLQIPFYKYNTLYKNTNIIDNTISNKLFITMANNTHNSFMELNKNYEIISSNLQYFISTVKNITLATNHGRYIIYITNHKLYAYNIYTNTNFNIDYHKKYDSISLLINEIIGIQGEITGICINNNELLFVITTSTTIYILNSIISYNTNNVSINNIKIIKTINKDYFNHIYNININIKNALFYNNYLFILSASQSDAYIIYIKWYKNFNSIGNHIYLTELNINGVASAFGIKINKFIIVYTDSNKIVKFFETDIQNII